MMCADNCVESVQSEVSLLGESNWSGVVFSPTTVWPLWIMMPSRRALARKSLPENSAHEMPVIRGIPRCFRWSRVLTHALVAHACQHDSVNSPLIILSSDYRESSALHSCVNTAFAKEVETSRSLSNTYIFFFMGGLCEQYAKCAIDSTQKSVCLTRDNWLLNQAQGVQQQWPKSVSSWTK